MSGSTSGIQAALPAQTQQNPLQTLSTIVGVQNDLARNKLLQQGLLNQQQELANLQLTNQTGQTNLAWAKRMNTAKTLYALNSQDDSGMMKDAPSVLEGLRADNNITDANYAQVKQDIDNNDVKALRTHLNNGIITTMTGPEALQAVQGTPRTVTLPGGMTQTALEPGPMAPPGTPSRMLGSPVGGGMSPEAGATLVYVKTPDGTEQGPYPMASIGELVRQGFTVSRYAAPGTPAPPVTAPVGTGGAPSSSPPSSSAPPSTTMPTQSTGAGAEPIKFGAALPNPDLLKANVNAYSKDQAELDPTWQRIRNNEIALKAFQMANTGKGTQEWYTLGQYLQSWGMVPDGSEWAKQINNQAEAVKYTAMALMTMPQVQSDARMTEMMKGVASETIPNEVAQSLLKTNIGNDRLFVSKVMNSRPTNYQADSSAFQQRMGEIGMIAHKWDVLSPEERGVLTVQLKKNPQMQLEFANMLGEARNRFFKYKNPNDMKIKEPEGQ